MIDWDVVLKYLLAGGGAGVALGSGVSLGNYMNNLHERSLKRKSTTDDDDTIFLDIPRNMGKQASASSTTVAASILATLLGTTAGYSGVRRLYQSERRKQLQREHDAAQRSYFLNVIDPQGIHNELDPQVKEASIFSGVTGTVLAAMILSGLGTGYVTNKILDKTFPPLKPPNDGHVRPSRVVIRSQPTTTDDKDGMVKVKEASEEDEISAEAIEHLIRTVIGEEKRASDSGFGDLIHAVAQGRADEILDHIDLGIDTVFELVKGASEKPVSKLDKAVAISWLSHDPAMSTALQPILAAEVYDMSPTFCKLARHLDEEDAKDLVGVVESIVYEVRLNAFEKVASKIKINTAEFMEKEARLPMMDLLFKNVVIADYLRKLSTNDHEQQPIVIREPKEDTIQVLAEDNEAEAFLNKHRDIIDRALGS